MPRGIKKREPKLVKKQPKEAFEEKDSTLSKLSKFSETFYKSIIEIDLVMILQEEKR